MKKKIGRLLILGILSLWGAQLYAQKAYSLDECIQLSLQNNLQMKNSQIDVRSVDSQIKEAKSGFLPSVDLTGQYQYYITMPKMLVPADMFGGVKGEYASVSFASPQTTTATFQVSQVLYNQKVFIGLKAAQTAKNLTELQLNKTKEDLIYNVSAIYYNIQVLNQNLSLLDSNIVSIGKMVDINKSLEANSILSKTNYKRLLINYENLKNERLNLGLTTEKAYNVLKFLMGFPVSDAVKVIDFEAKNYKLEAGFGNVENRTDIQLMSQQIELARIDKKASVANFYPSVAGVYNYSLTGYNDKFSLTHTINDQWLKGSFVALQLNIPIFSGFSRTEKVRQKDYALQKARNNYELVKLSAQKEMADAVNNYLSASNSFDNMKRSLDLAKEIFQSANTEYKSGLISISDLLQIQNDLTTARNNYSNAMVNLRLAEIELKKSKGELINK